MNRRILPRGPGFAGALVTVIALVAVSAPSVVGQFATSVTLVEVYATVTDAAGRPVTGLQRGDFRVREDGAPREIEAFAAGEFPLSAALAIDRSWSMAGAPLREARVAASRFLDQLRPADDAMVIGVSSEVETLAPLSHDRAVQYDALKALVPWGSTRLHDAILAALDEIGAARGRRALVVLSDGQDKGSAATAEQVTDRARRSDVIIYPVVLGGRNSALLTQLATFTGGRAFWVKRADQLGDAFGEVARELRHQYLIGYAPATDVRPGAWRGISVEVPGRRVNVRARPGYFVGP